MTSLVPGVGTRLHVGSEVGALRVKRARQEHDAFADALGRGRGGPRCMSCPIDRDDLPEE